MLRIDLTSRTCRTSDDVYGALAIGVFHVRAITIQAAVAALTAAADEDRATGGVDLERGIFPIIKLCTSSGHNDATNEEIATVYRSILDARAAGGNL